MFWFDNDFEIESKYHYKTVVLLLTAYILSLQDAVFRSMFLHTPSPNETLCAVPRDHNFHLLLHLEAIIGFTKNVYEIPEDKNAFVEFGFVSGRAAVPVTVRYETNILHFLA